MAIRRLSRNLCGSLKNPRSMDLSPIFARIFLRNPQISRKILELPLQIMRKFAESTLDSAFSCHSERSEESKKNPFVILSEAKYLKNRDSSPSAQNDKVIVQFAESSIK